MIELILGALALFGLGFFVFNRWVNKGQSQSESNADQILDEIFDGSPDVTYTVNMRSVKYETAVIGAKQRGYKLVHQADGQYGLHTLVFEKVSD